MTLNQKRQGLHGFRPPSPLEPRPLQSLAEQPSHAGIETVRHANQFTESAFEMADILVEGIRIP